VALALVWAHYPVSAQTVRPADERPELEEFAPETLQEPSLELAPLPLPTREERDRLSTGLMVFVEEFRFVGSTVFSDEELAEVTAPYRNREISSEELIEARDAITRHYVSHGYVTSGAIIPDQTVSDGVVEIQVVEGELAAIAIEETQRFRPRYLRQRLELAQGGPVNIHDLERRLQLLQQDPRIRRIHAHLEPGEIRGESFLRVRAEEESPYRLSFSAGNDESPSIGSESGKIRTEHQNLSGNGDILQASFALSEGLDEWDLSYAVPINRYDTTLDFHFRSSESEVVERPFDDLDIESKSTTYGVGVKHPIYRTPGAGLWVGLTGELRRSETSLFDEPFSFSAGAEDGDSKVSVLRFFQEWTSRSRNNVMASRSMFSFGLDILDASDSASVVSDGRTPDGTFFAWLGQFQWAHRLSERYRNTQVLFRTDVQLSTSPLLSLEQFSVGGRRSVRGYRENELVRDNGLVSSIEFRIPILRSALGRDVIQLAPFADFGHAWNEEETPSPKTLSSIGVGLRLAPSERLAIEAYWGGRLRHVERRGSSLQNNGFHIQAVMTAF
jgi:hemolysin activation/secretion protein